MDAPQALGQPLAREYLVWLLGSLSMAIAGSSAAQQVSTDSEEQRQRTQREAEERRQRQQAPAVSLQPPSPVDAAGYDVPDETPCFRVDRVLLVGERSEAFAWLEGALRGFDGRCIGREGINRVVGFATARLVERGYVTTRVGIPEQDLGSGTLRLVLVPGIVRAIRFADTAEAPERAWLSAFPLRPGDLLDLRAIEQGLEQMKRVASQDVTIDIVPGMAPGESDLVLTLKRGKPWRLGVILDDAGAKATGRRQATLTASFDNPLGLNDAFSLSVTGNSQREQNDRGSGGHTLQYSLPWGWWTASISGGVSRYRQAVRGTNQTFSSNGISSNGEIKLQRLVHRDQAGKTALQFRLVRRRSRSYLDDTELEVQRRRTSAAEIGLNHRRTIGAAQIDIALADRRGVPWFNGMRDAAGRSATSPTYAYRLQTVDLALVFPFKLAEQPLRWLATLRGQTTRHTLYSADQIAIGNRYTVRGFSGDATLSAERGHYLRNELELPFGDSGHAVYAGIDDGRVAGPGSNTLAGRHLAGFALGVRGGGGGVTYDLFAGWSLSRPEGFASGRPVAGFNLGFQF